MTRKILFVSLFVLFAVAAPVAAELLNYEEPYLRVDGGKPPPPIPERASSATAA